MKRNETQIMTTKQVAQYLQMSEITVCRLARDRKLPGIKIGKMWRFHKQAIDDLIADNTLAVLDGARSFEGEDKR